MNCRPKQLTDLRDQDFVFNVKNEFELSVKARKIAKEIFGVDGEPKINRLFSETEEGVQKSVYEVSAPDTDELAFVIL